MTPPDGGGDPFAPLTSQMLDVGDGHSLYVETVGRADGIPAVYLHGGPGSGCQPSHRRLFNPARFRALLFDQRGAGRSRPARSREHNTIQHLIADMELARTALGIERWLVVGGSWGATLGLAYAQTFPERVSGLVLRATFLGTRAELDWAFGTGLSAFHPGLYEDFLSILTPHERLSPLDAYFRRILDPNPAIHGPAARAWHDTERVLSEARPGMNRLDLDDIHNGGRLPATAFMEAHYFAQDSFLATGQLLAGAGRLKSIPGVIVQGQFDLLCPPAMSYALAKTWGNAEIVLVEGAGHAMSEPGVTEAVVAGINALAINHPRQ
ncbi:Proline iminopeptidase [Devosia sp. LC5]|uniref:prolyl aminopeptidase n=1 Tax=Devosia sp. LC5 TaxID=1502724 RepID=UPI0004E2BDDF|nr:prolyl aminopeptidase [Devosia sp. LC5]KFC67680.1 Proline iminopeptidase [Devosia sp. LC5]